MVIDLIQDSCQSHGTGGNVRISQYVPKEVWAIRAGSLQELKELRPAFPHGGIGGRKDARAPRLGESTDRMWKTWRQNMKYEMKWKEKSFSFWKMNSVVTVGLFVCVSPCIMKMMMSGNQSWESSRLSCTSPRVFLWIGPGLWKISVLRKSHFFLRSVCIFYILPFPSN